jgi:hypothetical protein
VKSKAAQEQGVLGSLRESQGVSRKGWVGFALYTFVTSGPCAMERVFTFLVVGITSSLNFATSIILSHDYAMTVER